MYPIYTNKQSHSGGLAVYERGVNVWAQVVAHLPVHCHCLPHCVALLFVLVLSPELHHQAPNHHHHDSRIEHLCRWCACCSMCSGTVMAQEFEQFLFSWPSVKHCSTHCLFTALPRPILVQELFILVPRLFGTTSRCLSVQPFQLLPLRNIWRHISFTWPFPHRYRHSPWPVDVTELFARFCCWTLIRLLRHWAWLRRGYWRYRTLIDWLLDWLIFYCSHESFCFSIGTWPERSHLSVVETNHFGPACEDCEEGTLSVFTTSGMPCLANVASGFGITAFDDVEWMISTSGTCLFYSVPLSLAGPLTGTGRASCILHWAGAQPPHSCAGARCLVVFPVPRVLHVASMEGLPGGPKTFPDIMW